MADIDHFKRINDTHGHAIGDQVLEEVARIISELAGGADRVARWGGEEFLILLPATDHTEALGAAERMRRAVEQRPAQAKVQLTMSLGVVTSTQEADLEKALCRADANLYRAKREGRNRVVG